MNIFSLIKMSLSSMLSNKMRTALTVLGIVIGIASVIIVYSAGEGINNLVVGQIETFGTDIIEVEIKMPTNKKAGNVSSAGAADLVQGVQITSLVLDDMEDVNKLPNIKNSYAGLMGQEQASYGNEQRKAIIYAVSASFIDIDKGEVAEGRFFTAEEEKSLAQLAVIGPKMKEKLFGDNEALNKLIKIRKNKYRVIGIMKERGAMMGVDFDDFIYLPVKTVQKRLMGINHVSYFISQVENMDYAEETAAEIRALLRENHNIKVESADDFNKDDFRVVTMKEMMSMMDTVTGALTLLLLAIVAISLIVGGVGILNIMYVAVNERTAEIGLRKAVGAKYGDIMRQFLIEAVLITILGGIAGIIIGVLMSYLISFGANASGLSWKFSIPARAYIVAIAFSLVFGIFFGVYPARKAARMDPIEALRKE